MIMEDFNFHFDDHFESQGSGRAYLPERALPEEYLGHILMSTTWRTLVVWCLSYPSGDASLSQALRFFGSSGGLILESVYLRMQASPQSS